MRIKINCDIGESFGVWEKGNDEKIIPYPDLANLACGFHASDVKTINKVVHLAKKNNVIIGAHPSYQEILSFGGKTIPYAKNEVVNIILYQLGALHAFCLRHDTQISYIKPHGGLYSDMMNNEDVFREVLTAIKFFNPNLNLMIISTPRNDYYKNIAKEFNIKLLFEVFLDRNYNNDGSLVSREDNNAVIHNVEEIIDRTKSLKEFKYIKTIKGKKLYIDVDSVCIHSDNKDSLKFIKIVKDVLDEKV